MSLRYTVLSLVSAEEDCVISVTAVWNRVGRHERYVKEGRNRFCGEVEQMFYPSFSKKASMVTRPSCAWVGERERGRGEWMKEQGAPWGSVPRPWIAAWPWPWIAAAGATRPLLNETESKRSSERERELVGIEQASGGGEGGVISCPFRAYMRCIRARRDPTCVNQDMNSESCVNF
jgi:hypothetical protein